MTDVSGLALKEPSQIDWDNYAPSSTFVPPPPALGVDGKPITYFGVLPTQIVPEVAEKGFAEGYRSYLLDPIKLTKSGKADGYEVRFTRVTVKNRTKKLPDGTEKELNSSPAGDLIKAAGILAKPQKTSEYDAAVKMSAGKVVPFTIDWSAYNKDTGEKIDGYRSFPDDPDNPGFKKVIVKAGDVVTDYDRKGQPIGSRVIKSEVLFANARVRYFVDPTRKGR